MIRFESDYLEGAHPQLLEALAATNLCQTPGYGEDEYCESAREKIRKAIHRPDADVHFLVGGTQANLTVIASALRPYQGVLAADTGHIAVHESGAIEATGHKVITLPGETGKLRADAIRACVRAHLTDATHEHMAQPGMAYISQSTELGTLYTREELSEIARACREAGIYLYIDGARLGYALAAGGPALPDIAAAADVFYIGGTKVGALFGEAVVIVNPALKKDFRYMMKQRGGMLAKGRLLGVQFDRLFTNGLYEEISAHAIAQAARVREALVRAGARLLIDSPTNQLFPIFEDGALAELQKTYAFAYWQRVDGAHSAVRIATSWATRPEHVTALIRDIEKLRANGPCERG